MTRRTTICLMILAVVFGLSLSPQCLAREWSIRKKPEGTLKVVELFHPGKSVFYNYGEGLVTLDRNNNRVPCLAEDWRWIDDRTIEFKLREGVWFHNGEKFNAEAVRVNWEEYREMEKPNFFQFEVIPDETIFDIIDDYTVRFTFPAPSGLAFVKFLYFRQIAPSFFLDHKFDKGYWGFLPEPGPWGTGPFMLAEGRPGWVRNSDLIVLEAYERYWDRRYPKVQKVIFDNTLIRNRDEAMRLCRETEGEVDIVGFIRPLDTLKVAESPYAKVVKDRNVTSLGGWFNRRKKDSKWQDIRLRKAVNYAINRKELLKYAAKGNAYNLSGQIYNTIKAKSLLAEAGYPDGIEVNMFTHEAWKLEAQIVSKMLERIGFRMTLDVLTQPEFVGKMYVPWLDKPPEEQDWDLGFTCSCDYYGHIGASFQTWVFVEDSDMRWIEYDPVYERIWSDMARTLDSSVQEEKMQQMAKYAHDNVCGFYIYSPLTLYAVNKQVNFVPQKFWYLRLKETSVTENHWSVRGKNN